MIFNSLDFGIGVVSVFNSFTFTFLPSFTGIPQLIGVGISLYQFDNKLTHFQAIWGLDASQDSNQLVIKKVNLPGLTAKSSNLATAVLLGIINNLIENFPVSISVPVEAYIFSRYVDSDYEYLEAVIKCKAKLTVVEPGEIQYLENPFDPDNF